jgi:hypothetical protein
LLALEDLHWADEASLDVLSLLARRLDGVPVLMVVTYRDDELGATHPLRIVLGELATNDVVTRMKLIRDAVLARVARLSSPARALLNAAAVVPLGCEYWDALGGPSEHLDECLSSGVLVAGAANVSFRHELARIVVEEALLPSRRVRLHQLALEALMVATAPDPARLAHHAEAAHNASAVLRFAPEAATRASALGAHREAARRGEPEAWALARQTGELQRIEPVAAARAEAYWLTGRNDEVEAATSLALELASACRATRVVGEMLSWRRRAGMPSATAGPIPEPFASEFAGDWLGARDQWRNLYSPYEAALALAETGDETGPREALEGAATARRPPRSRDRGPPAR